MASVTLKGVRKTFQDTDVLHGVDITIAHGSFTVLVGPSGCGKSTLLRMLAGLEEVTGGEIYIGDTLVNTMQPKERDIAMVFQNYALYPHMTVRDNMGFSLKLAKIPAAQIQERVKTAADILGLDQLLDRYPRQLSGGQRQRVAMGRAIVRNPQVFLFDEPLSNLDAKLRVQMRTEIKALHQRLKTTSVYVTHDQIEAMTMGDQIVVMRDGVIEQAGDPLTLYETPVNTFVAGFIGSPAMNLLAGQLEHEQAKTFIRLDAGAQILYAQHLIGSPGQRVYFGTRPEHLAIDPAGALTVTARVIEPTGAETFVVCHLGEQEMVAVFRDRVQLVPGQELRLQPNVEKSHLFDFETGRVIKPHSDEGRQAHSVN
jgi:multiple sugar transport system ATP-binding protein